MGFGDDAELTPADLEEQLHKDKDAPMFASKPTTGTSTPVDLEQNGNNEPLCVPKQRTGISVLIEDFTPLW
jgi:hypothetical protein